MCALAGATLLYTGCTKDYSEDIHSLEGKVAVNTADIASLRTDLNTQVSNINAAIDALKSADAEANKLITALTGRVSTLEGKVSDLEAAKIKLEQDVQANKEAIDRIDGEITSIKGQIADINGDITALKNRVKANEDAIADLQTKKADKTWVEEELAKKADKTWVEQTLQNYATVKQLVDSTAALQARLDVLKSNVTELKDSLSALTANFREVAAIVADLQQDMTQAKLDIKKAQETADTALARANRALSETAEIRELLNLYAKITYVDQQDRILKEELTAIIGTKVDTSVFRIAMEAVDTTIKGVIRDYMAADAKIWDELGKKVDTAAFGAYERAIRTELNGIHADLNTLFARVQSLVYVPNYDDGRITFNWAIMPLPQVLDPKVSYVIPTSAHVKYRIYGEDAATIVEALAEDYATLSFDVVAVNTRVNDDGVTVKILTAKQDEKDPCVLDLTVKPLGIADAFYFNTWENDGYFNAAEGFDGKVPAYSISLVMTNPEESKLITSTYENCVPAFKPEVIIPSIKDKNGVDVSGNEEAETIEIVYDDLTTHNVLEGHQVLFKIEDIYYTNNQLKANFIDLPEVVCSIFDTTDYTGAIDPTKVEDLDPEYMLINTDATTVPGTADVKLTKQVREGVGSEGAVVFTYTIAYADVLAGSVIKVVPKKIPVTADIWEAADQQAFTWEYVADAPVDEALFLGTAENFYKRLACVPVFGEGNLEAVAAADIKIVEDFSHKTPATFEVSYWAKGEEIPVDLENDPIHFYPYFEDGALKVNVTDFLFYKGEASMDSITYKAVYNIPNDVQPFVVVPVTGKIVIDDRDRTPIVITLPDTVEDIEVNMYVEAKDSLFAGEELVPTVETSFAAHHLTNANIKDAFGKVETRTWGVFQVNDPITTTAVLYAQNTQFRGQAGYFQNERIDSVTMDLGTVEAGRKLVFKPTTDLARNNTTAHTETEYLVDEDNVLNFRTTFKVNAFDLRNKFIGNYADYTSYLTLWYGQEVIVKKSFKFNNDGIFDYERIPEYVTYNGANDCFTTLQPLWQPDGATTDFTIPVTSYDASKVLLNQHFRIRDVLNDVVVTDLKGVIKDEYSYLRRQFWLENAEGEKVASIADPRNFNPDWKVIIDNALTDETPFNEEPNVLSYYSKAPQTDVYGDLYLFNENGSFFVLKTRFDRPAGETYENYVIKLYDPLLDLKLTNDNEKQLINVNNSIMTVTSIYEFLTLKDKRQKELIDASTANGWVIGNNTNGFATGVTTDAVYSMTFTHTMEYLTEVSEETKARISFDETTGKLTYDNTLQTQLANPIDIKLTIKVEYPWGTRAADVVVEFYNKPVGE